MVYRDGGGTARGAIASSGAGVWERYGFAGVVAAGMALRLVVTVLAGNEIRPPWGGGGDSATYLLLAHNLLDGKGFSYAGIPSAFRAPGYPLMLAGSLKLFGAHALMFVRWVQCVEGLAVALLCGAVAGRIYGAEAKKAALVVALLFPTLIEINTEILTETSATLAVATIIYLCVRQLEDPRWWKLLALGTVIGIGTLFRFNMVLFGPVALGLAISQKGGVPKWRSVAIVVLTPLLVISPWVVRNWKVFHGSVWLSTASGINAIQGVLAPQGRALPGDAERLRAALGWVPPVDIETNSASRRDLPGEPVLDRECWKAAVAAWRMSGWMLMPLAAQKLGYFWLSTDQLFWTGAFGLRQRLLRATGVAVYLVLLALGIAGWFRLRERNPALAGLFLCYAGWVTVFHLPFNMLTRYRIPFIEPIVAVLGGIGVLLLYGSHRKSNAPLEDWAGMRAGAADRGTL